VTGGPLPPAIVAYQARFNRPLGDDAPWDSVRFVALDSETTGLNPQRDSLITVGAVAVIGGDILLQDAFEIMMPIRYNNASVTVHGITVDEARGGVPEPEALEAFLDCLGDGVIVGHHILHDITALNVACDRHFGMALQNRFLDTMDLTLHLERDGALPDNMQIAGFSLDQLCHLFSVVPHDRHTAAGDAFITAQVFQRLLARARPAGRVTLGALTEPFPVPAPLQDVERGSEVASRGR
jgi:DNA polymerase-3 subunit epsilon